MVSGGALPAPPLLLPLLTLVLPADVPNEPKWLVLVLPPLLLLLRPLLACAMLGQPRGKLLCSCRTKGRKLASQPAMMMWLRSWRGLFGGVARWLGHPFA